ncbi:MAG TPA: NAD(P)H-binding protein, partial [Microbacteriaceae bacterium]
MMMILVVGGTGTLGRLLVRSLIACGDTVRVLTRSTTVADALAEQGAEPVIGDLRDADTVRRAVAGCAAVVAAASGFGPMGSSTPTSVDCGGNLTLIGEAAKAGVGRFVFVSVRGAAPDARLELARMKYAAEQALSSSAMMWTIVRPSPFLETYLAIVGQPMARRNTTLVFGNGAAVVNFVSVRDVAALVGKALRDPALAGKTVEWGGANFTLNDLSTAIHKAAGRPGPTSHVPIGMLRAA